ncbi:MAG: helix-turn-helix domain-containing protein [Solirubrobacterales bacterium]
MKSSILIRDARLRAGLSQKQLADALGTKQPAIARWESGEVDAGTSTTSAALLACGFELDTTLVPVDRERRIQLKNQLALTPEQRVQQLTNAVRFIERARANGKRAA